MNGIISFGKDWQYQYVDETASGKTDVVWQLPISGCQRRRQAIGICFFPPLPPPADPFKIPGPQIIWNFFCRRPLPFVDLKWNGPLKTEANCKFGNGQVQDSINVELCWKTSGNHSARCFDDVSASSYCRRCYCLCISRKPASSVSEEVFRMQLTNAHNGYTLLTSTITFT